MSEQTLDFEQYQFLTFDCYGTLVDWEKGILNAIQKVLHRHNITIDSQQLFELFDRFEQEVKTKSENFIKYREVLNRTMQKFADHFDVRFSQSEIEALASSVANWPLFPDTNEALEFLKQKYKLVVVSNIDEDLFAQTANNFSVSLDNTVLAEQIQSYKPATKHFEITVQRLGTTKENILHVAQSIIHDIIPANNLGWDNIWVRRYRGRLGTPTPESNPMLTVDDLQSLVDLIKK